MELKFAYRRILSCGWSCSNRTFMELKFMQLSCAFNQKPTFKSYLYGIEIKLIVNLWICLFMVLIVPLWNWNWAHGTKGIWVVGSNRTFMELKFRKSIRIICCKLVLIVPLWNWNYIFLHYCPLKIAKCSLKWLNISLLQKKIVRNDLRFIRHSSDRM